MCGIAASFCYGGGTVDRAALQRARDCMQARGPDASGYWESEGRGVALAHRRLSIIDLSDRGAQPMAAEEQGLRVIYNGEIYNHQALRDELEGKGYRFQSDTDTEVLLYLYAEHGRDFVDRLRGMYAFALYDESREGLLMARDPHGIKPLYYADDGRALHLASQVQALRGIGAVNTSPNPAGHVGFFLWGHVPEPHTLYEGIRALPAGHTCWVDRENGVQAPRAFASVPEALRRVDTASNGRPPRPALREALLDSVRQHLIADVDVGLFLSAGLDSATLTALASEVRGGIKTVTLGFEEFRGTPNDEVPGAERIASRYGTDHETVWVTQGDFAAARDDFLGAMDQPTIDGANSYFVSRAAREAGLKVALSGLGGDELFGGYPSFSQIPRLVSTVEAVPGAATVGKGLRAVAAPVIGQMTSPKYAGLLEYGGDYGGAYLLRRGLYMPWELPDVLDSDLARAGWESLQPRLRLQETVAGIQTPHLRVAALESSRYMRSRLLRDTDWASMAHSLEVRTPLVDWDLWQRVAPLVVRHGLTKQDMAKTPEISLPEDLLDRPKSGFFVPMREWLLSDRPEYASTRGLRGWAQYVYDQTVSTR
ncbi:MAG: asparagine synthase (glutamine-hydrolyzing) [Salinibacter sp.]|uniref:asparagine synthase (glutamine-hydrolyzing) n=1 Tax=Salinibacter sp. TaxID=2065818 RepID=UPI0035D47307